MQRSNQTIDENSSFEVVQEVLKQYVTISEDGVHFNTEKAIEDGQSEFVMETGKLMNQLDQEYDSSGIPIPIWGNWCGPGHGGGTPKDLLDKACMYHDLDYAKYGYFDCESDLRLITRILAWYDDMAVLEKMMAINVFFYFKSQRLVKGC